MLPDTLVLRTGLLYNLKTYFQTLFLDARRPNEEHSVFHPSFGTPGENFFGFQVYPFCLGTLSMSAKLQLANLDMG
jgi:hypothetical protein